MNPTIIVRRTKSWLTSPKKKGSREGGAVFSCLIWISREIKVNSFVFIQRALTGSQTSEET